MIKYVLPLEQTQSRPCLARGGTPGVRRVAAAAKHRCEGWIDIILKTCKTWALLSLLGFVMLGVSCSEPAETEGVEIELWTLALRPRFTTYIEDVIGTFEQAHPGVKVRWVDVPFDALSRKLIAAAAAGQAPDVVNISDLQYARFASLGATRDLTPLLNFDPTSVYLEGALAPAQIDGKLGALPWYLSTQVRFINTQLLKAGGLDADSVGSDWAGLMTQARAYYQETGGFYFSVPLAVESELPVMLIADGKPPFTESDGRLRADLTRGEVVSFVQAWVDLYREGILPREAATAGHAHVVELYQNGQIAVAVTGANFLSRIASSAPDIFEATAVRPTATGELNRSHIAVMFLSVTSTSKHPQEAAALAAWLTNPQNQLAFCQLVNILPSTPGVLDDSLFDAPTAEHGTAETKIAAARSISARSLRSAVAFTPALGTWPDLRRSFDEGIKSALLDGRDVQETLKDIEAEWNQILDAAIPATLDAVPQPGPADDKTMSRGTQP